MSWQNLNEPNREGKRRHWFDVRTWFGNHRWQLELCAPSGFGLRTSFASHPFRITSVSIQAVLGFYLSREADERREFELYWYKGDIVFTPWGRDGEWRREDPWWVRGVRLNIANCLLGKMRHEHVIHSPGENVLVPMPEGCYPAVMKREERTWRRPRWPWRPFTRNSKYIDIELPGGIPFEGKGENSWDCGEDGLWGCGSDGWSQEKAVAHVVQVVLENRSRYGGSMIHRGRPPVMAAPRQVA